MTNFNNNNFYGQENKHFPRRMKAQVQLPIPHNYSGSSERKTLPMTHIHKLWTDMLESGACIIVIRRAGSAVACCLDAVAVQRRCYCFPSLQDSSHNEHK